MVVTVVGVEYNVVNRKSFVEYRVRNVNGFARILCVDYGNVFDLNEIAVDGILFGVVILDVGKRKSNGTRLVCDVDVFLFLPALRVAAYL